MDDVNVVLETVWNPAVPHRYREQIAVCGDEAGGDLYDLIPGALLHRVLLLPEKYIDLGGGLVAVESGQFGLPEREYIDLQRGVRCLEGVKVGLSDLDRLGLLPARGGLNEEQLRHGRAPCAV